MTGMECFEGRKLVFLTFIFIFDAKHVAMTGQGLAEPSPKLVTAQSRYELMALQSFLVLQQSAPLFSQ